MAQDNVFSTEADRSVECHSFCTGTPIAAEVGDVLVCRKLQEWVKRIGRAASVRITVQAAFLVACSHFISPEQIMAIVGALFVFHQVGMGTGGLRDSLAHSRSHPAGETQGLGTEMLPLGSTCDLHVCPERRSHTQSVPAGDDSSGLVPPARAPRPVE